MQLCICFPAKPTGETNANLLQKLIRRRFPKAKVSLTINCPAWFPFILISERVLGSRLSPFSKLCDTHFTEVAFSNKVPLPRPSLHSSTQESSYSFITWSERSFDGRLMRGSLAFRCLVVWNLGNGLDKIDNLNLK